MNGLRTLFASTALLAGLALAPAAQAQLVIDIGGPPPNCAYGYYGYSPYACAPYGYYGPGYFYNGIFLGMGPWGGWGYSHGWGGHRFVERGRRQLSRRARSRILQHRWLAVRRRSCSTAAQQFSAPIRTFPCTGFAPGSIARASFARSSQRRRITRRWWRRIARWRRRSPLICSLVSTRRVLFSGTRRIYVCAQRSVLAAKAVGPAPFLVPVP